MPPRIESVLETAIYVDDMDAAQRFYGEVLGLTPMLASARLAAYDVAPGAVFLVFKRGETEEDSTTPGGTVPGHHSDGPAHFALAVSADAYDDWIAHLAESGIALVSEVVWPRGGRSLYVHDPDGNLVELATPGLWANY